MQMQKNPMYENVKSVKNSDSDQPHPYRTEMSLILSYNGNKSKYSTTKNIDKAQESDIETPPPNVPQAMKLLPNQLPYATKNDLLKDKLMNSPMSEQGNVNIENSANEQILSKSQVTQSGTGNTVQSPEYGKTKNVTLNTEIITKNGKHKEAVPGGDTNNPNTDRRESNEQQKSVRDLNKLRIFRTIEWFHFDH